MNIESDLTALKSVMLRQSDVISAFFVTRSSRHLCKYIGELTV